MAAAIPCYRVKRHILTLLSAIGAEVGAIYVVDDACPEGSGDWVASGCDDPRVRVLRHTQNQGVGGATITGMRQALADGAEVIIKLDGDGQMDPAFVPTLIAPILAGEADYAKGNRFFDPESVAQMPTGRIIGNAVLSFLAKLSTGYWDIFDPTNGFLAIHARVAARLPWEKLARGYFFETDMLFRLNTLRAVVMDAPMSARYGDEASGLNGWREAPRFLAGHARCLLKRLFYNYYLRDFSVASLELPLGVALLLFGVIFGAWKWLTGYQTGAFSSAGTVMLAALPVLLGVQLLLAFLQHDARSVPRAPLHKRLR
ncbi:putative family 2 glycosyl transferase [Magnetofaba australis IT-1]|uniref:Putative family 2 glycosyl transferase n=1 Tax=Magnetofaba australis IT-1 TaxID=1434232 RepID=A0A1Y2K1K2_9PROT|nr:putative family 2 glycosyl transferase [Magnetofaba australis IT-1]